MAFNKFGLHFVALQCSDVNNRTWLRSKFKEFKNEWGAHWIKLISSPGGDDNWSNKELGCAEWSLAIALETQLKPVMRLFRGHGAKVFWDADVSANLTRLKNICNGYILPVEPSNEVDAEWGGPMTLENAKQVCHATALFARKCLEMGGILPLFPSVGYGGPGFNFLEIFCDLGYSELLSQMGIAIHPYRGAYPLNWGTDYVLTEMTREEYNSYHPWCWDVGKPDYRSLEMVNQWRREEITERQKYITLEEKISHYNYGWFTIDWAAHQLEKYGIDPADKFFLTECGVEVGSKDIKGIFPRVDPKQHCKFTLEQIYAAESDPRIVMTAFWIAGNMKYSGNTPNWETQAYESDWYNPSIVELPWAEQIITPGRLPVVDELIRLNKESMPMKSKLFFHVQNPRDYALNAIRDSQPEYIKVMGNALNPDKIALIKQYAPNAKLIGRYHLDNQSYDNPEYNAAWLVDEIAKTGCGPLMWAWESYNEVAVSTLNTEQVRNLDHFFATFHKLIKQRFGVEHSIVINSPTGNLGWPNEVSPADFTESLSLDGTIASFHCYEYHQAPANDREAHLFRWKRLVDQVLNKFPNKKFLLTEVGVTELALGQPHPDVGWSYRGAYSEQEYMKVLYDLDVEMCKYPAVIGACVFQTGCNDDWLAAGFESSEQVKKHRVSFIPPQPVFTNPIRVKRTKLGIIETLELEEYLRGVVPGEMFPTWPIEALKAQAIAARSYAMANIRDRKNQPYDVDDTTNFQVYAPDLIHPNTDLAIRETKGVHILRNGRVILAEYKAHCGRSICVNCKGQNYQVWEGQLCQYGSRDLAQTGKKYAEILRTYYGQDIVLSNEEAIPEGPEMPEIPTWTLTKDPQSDYFAVGADGKVIASIANIKAYPETTEWTWRVREIDFINEAEAKGDINIYVYLEDEYGNPCDEEVQFAWPSSRLDGPYDGSVTVMSLVEKVASFTMGGGNFFPQKSTDYGPYLVKVLGLPSDTVYGFGLPGNRHVAWKVTFRKARKLHVPEEQPEEPVPTDPPTEEEIRNELWNHPISMDVIPYNPEHAFPKKARENNLGAPLGNTWDWRGLRLQKYAMGNLYCVVGDWQNIKVIKY